MFQVQCKPIFLHNLLLLEDIVHIHVELVVVERYEAPDLGTLELGGTVPPHTVLRYCAIWEVHTVIVGDPLRTASEYLGRKF